MSRYVGEICATLAASGIIGLVVMYGLVNSLKSYIKALGDEIVVMRDNLKNMVTERECDRRHEGIAKDINNIAEIARNR